MTTKTVEQALSDLGEAIDAAWAERKAPPEVEALAREIYKFHHGSLDRHIDEIVIGHPRATPFLVAGSPAIQLGAPFRRAWMTYVGEAVTILEFQTAQK